QGRIDEVLQARRTSFFSDFDVRKHVPAWIYEGDPATEAARGPEATPPKGSAFEDALPEEVDARSRLLVLLVMTRLMTGNHEAAAKSLAESKGLPPSVHAWLTAQ